VGWGKWERFAGMDGLLGIIEMTFFYGIDTLLGALFLTNL